MTGWETPALDRLDAWKGKCPPVVVPEVLEPLDDLPTEDWEDDAWFTSKPS